MEELTNSMDQFNELVIKVKSLAISPKVGDIIINGNKFYMKSNSQPSLLNSSLTIYFFSESRDFAKKLAKEVSYESMGKIRFEIKKNILICFYKIRETDVSLIF